jgi:His-Xaa-Ser system radical SAM maturase HxsC
MKKIIGSPLNIRSTIIGRLTREPVRLSKRHDFILIAGEKRIEHGYAAVISTKPLKNLEGMLSICNVIDIEQLNDGDIVSIDGNGIINILYKKNVFHNALLVTARCNCSCIMCPQPRVNREEDKTPLNLKLISLMDKNTGSLGITGGEPTLIGDKLIDIVAACKERLPKTSLTLLTNGIKLENFDYVKRLVAIQHHDLLIDIPLYADTDTEHNKIIGTRGFFKTIKGLYNLALFNQKIGIRIVIHRLTYERLPQLAEFIYHNFPFIFHIAFMQMETEGLARENIDVLWIDPHDYNEKLEKAINYLDRRGMNVSIYNAQLCVLPKSLWRYARKSISSWKNIYIDECMACDYKNKCGGLFASSKDIHSSHIRPLMASQVKLNVSKNIININQNIRLNSSKILLKYISHILKMKDSPVLDVPCGFGRHSFLLASLGFEVICADIDQKALDYISEYQKKSDFARALTILKTDLKKDKWRFEKKSIGTIINVHYYQYNLLDKFIVSLMSGGFLYLETPSGHGGNYIDLPTENSIQFKLEPYFKILYYKERKTGPSELNRVTVKVFAQRL